MQNKEKNVFKVFSYESFLAVHNSMSFSHIVQNIHSFKNANKISIKIRIKVLVEKLFKLQIKKKRYATIADCC